MSGRFYHNCYGMNFVSDFLLPEVKQSLAPIPRPDIDIRFGEVNADGLGDERQCGPFLWIDNEARGSETVQLHIPNVARFRIIAGREIIIDPAPEIDLDSVRLFLLGSAFGALLFQRGYLVMHGNSVRVGDGCIVCVGNSGAGKSTLAAAFHQRGYDLLADDVVPVDDDARALIGFPRIKLWKDAADKLGIDTEGLSRIRPEMEKFNFPIHPPDMAPRLPVKAIYILGSDNNDTVRIDPITGFDKFSALKAHTYRLRFMENMSLQPTHLKLCGQLANTAQMRLVTRPRTGFDIDGLMDTIITDLDGPA